MPTSPDFTPTTPTPITVRIDVDAAAAVRRGQCTAGPHTIVLTPAILAALTPGQIDTLARHVYGERVWCEPLSRWAPPVGSADVATLAGLLDLRRSMIDGDREIADGIMHDVARVRSVTPRGYGVWACSDGEIAAIGAGVIRSVAIDADGVATIVTCDAGMAERIASAITGSAVSTHRRDAVIIVRIPDGAPVLGVIADAYRESVEARADADRERAEARDRESAAAAERGRLRREACEAILREHGSPRAVDRWREDALPEPEIDAAWDAWAIAKIVEIFGLDRGEISARRIADFSPGAIAMNVAHWEDRDRLRERMTAHSGDPIVEIEDGDDRGDPERSTPAVRITVYAADRGGPHHSISLALLSP